MATNDFCLPFKEDIAVSDNSKDQYSNLNLNQNQKCSNFNPTILKFISSKKYKAESSDIIDKKVSHKKLNSWSPPKASSNWLNAASEKQKLKRDKNSSLNSINKSTLSLHISAYENSNESATFDSTENAGLKKDKDKLHLKKQLFPGLASIIQNPFEFPRQQESKQFSADDPEVMGFKASHTLLDPNKATASKSVQLNDVKQQQDYGLNRPSSLLSYNIDDGWDFADPVDILPKLPNHFQELIASKKWKERKEALEGFLALATDNIKLDSKANYGEIVDILSKILSKDASINVCSVAAKCITQLAKGLRTKFGLYAATFVPVIFEKFKEKKALLRDPLIEAIDAIYPTTSINAICDPIAAALGKPNPNIKIQTNQFLYRVFKTFNAQTAPKTVVKTLTPLIAKCTGVSDAEVREASFAALGAIMKAIGKSNAMKMLGDVANDKTKMDRIEKFYYQAVEEAQEEEAAKKAAAEQAAGSSHPAEASLSEATTQSTASSIAAPAAAVAEVDPWDFVDPVDILPKLPEKFEETVASKKWQERKEVLEVLLQLATDNIRLDPKANYGEIVATLTKILSKDANINVCAVAAKCITQLARGLRSKFANHAPSIIEVIFEKFKEKKTLLRDPLVEAIDAVYAATTIEAVSENVVAALGKPNPNIKIQTNLFLYRVFKAFNVQTAPKKIIKTLTPLIAKCTGESDAEAREAAFSALGAIMKAMGKNKFRLFVTTMLGDVANDKTKMERIEKFYNQAVEDAKKAIAQQAAGSSHPVEKDPNIGKIVECKTLTLKIF